MSARAAKTALLKTQAADALRLKIRRIVWTGAIASVTAVGAWYGAGLKVQQDQKQVWICQS
jgi:hypothetical protein